MKIYARQVPWDLQESPLWTDGEFPENIIVDGNRSYKRRITSAYDTLISHLYEAALELDDIASGCGWYANATEAVEDFFPPQHKAKYSTKDVHLWKNLLQQYQTCGRLEEEDLICEGLKLMTGIAYSYYCLRGCCQGDWNSLYYPKDYGTDFAKRFETEYFNLGTAWIIHDEDSIPEGPEDIDGYYMYAYGTGADDIRLEISKEFDVSKEDIVLYEFTGYHQVPVYNVA